MHTDNVKAQTFSRRSKRAISLPEQHLISCVTAQYNPAHRKVPNEIRPKTCLLQKFTRSGIRVEKDERETESSSRSLSPWCSVLHAAEDQPPVSPVAAK